MLSANFKSKRTAAASRDFLATARLSCTNFPENQLTTVYALFLIVFLCCCVFVVTHLLNNWMGAMAGLGSGRIAPWIRHCQVPKEESVVFAAAGFCTSRTPFLPPNQQHQSTEEWKLTITHHVFFVISYKLIIRKYCSGFLFLLLINVLLVDLFNLLSPNHSVVTTVTVLYAKKLIYLFIHLIN